MWQNLAAEYRAVGRGADAQRALAHVGGTTASPMRIAKMTITSTSPSKGPRRFSQLRAILAADIEGLDFISAAVAVIASLNSAQVTDGLNDQLWLVILNKMASLRRAAVLCHECAQYEESHETEQFSGFCHSGLFQILIQRWVQQCLCVGGIEVV